jgi:FAD/FMN-containing dehydrogenase
MAFGSFHDQPAYFCRGNSSLPRLTRRAALTGSLATLTSRSFLRAQTVSRSLVEGLRARITGQLIVPDDPGYEQARKPISFNPTTDHHPQVIVRCATREDVAGAVVFAHEHALEVAIRSGGHDVLGASVCDGMVIDLSALKKTAIDPVRRTAHVESGVRSWELNGAAQVIGLAAVLGCHPGVGVAGLTIGGGLGWFLGKHGASCDQLLGADVITAEGKAVRASKSENPDLYWALRGGGGNFGIATALDLQLHPVNEVLGGVLVLRADVAGFLRFYSSFMQAAPAELTVEISIIPGKEPSIIAITCWSGDTARGEAVLKPLRSFGSPLADWIGQVPYARLTNRMSEVGPLLGLRQPQSSGPGYNYWRGGSLHRINSACGEQIAAAIGLAPEGCSLGVGHYMHGRVCQVARHETPLIRTAGQVTYFINASWNEPNRSEAHMQWVDRSWAAMKTFSSGGAYINYLSIDEQTAVQESYLENYSRLVQIKRRYDPSNFFHRNRNIRA